MGQVQSLFQTLATQFNGWLVHATSDLLSLALAIAKHSTPGAIELLLLIASAGLLATTTSLFVRRRVQRRARIRHQSLGFSSALAGLSQFELERAQLWKDASAEIPSGFRDRTVLARTGTRVETRVVDVAPHHEQSMIDLMARFKWRLKSSTPVKTKDTHLEQRGDKIYSVTETEDYIHLVFERDLDDPNIRRVKALEAEYYSIVIPSIPGYTGPIVLMILSAFSLFGALIVWPLCIWWMTNISKRKKEAELVIPKLRARQQDILQEVDQL